MNGGRIHGFAGVLIWTEPARFDAMARFYRDTLGLTPRSDRPDFINFDWGGVRLSVSVHDRVHGASRDPLRIMVNLAVDDIRAMHAHLAAAGVVFTRAPSLEDWGGQVATLLDPDGNLVQLFQLP
jgi:catechol 2,3-dioxygenase-like lactoylglutathione lyase family enzyme